MAVAYFAATVIAVALLQIVKSNFPAASQDPSAWPKLRTLFQRTLAALPPAAPHPDEVARNSLFQMVNSMDRYAIIEQYSAQLMDLTQTKRDGILRGSHLSVVR